MRRQLFQILQFHILILLFQLAFRQLIIDTTFVRDIGIFIMCTIYFTGKKDSIYRRETVGTMVRIYLWYGVLMSLFHIVDGYSAIDAVVAYRNHFFPFIIFFFALYIFRDGQFRRKWVDFLYIIFLILLIDVYIEAFLSIVGFPREVLPWYQYQIVHYYRFTDDTVDAQNLMRNLASTPIIGFLGWNNPTSCALSALFSFFLPFLLHSNTKEASMPRVARLARPTKIILFVLTIGAMAILTIKTPFAALAVVFFVYCIKGGAKNAKSILIVSFITAVVAVLTFSLWGDTYTELAEETKGEYGMSYIFDPKVIGALISVAFSDSPIAFLFGTDITNNSMYTLLEVRLIVHTIQFGVLWLLIYSLMMISTIKSYNRIGRNNIDTFDRLLALGAFLLVLSYLVDFLHYAHVMFLFHCDIFVVTIALLVAIKQRKIQHEG